MKKFKTLQELRDYQDKMNSSFQKKLCSGCNKWVSSPCATVKEMSNCPNKPAKKSVNKNT